MITDVIFGSLATLIAAIGTFLLRKKPLLAAACPVLANAVIVGLVLSLTNGWPVALTMLEVGAGEAPAVLALLSAALPGGEAGTVKDLNGIERVVYGKTGN